METEVLSPLRLFFLPLMSPGHMIPMVDMAKLFALRSEVSVTIITTPGNEPLVRPSIRSSPIELVLIPFPSSVALLLPDGKENLGSLPFSDFHKFFDALSALRQPVEEILYARRPNCIVSDYMFPWTADTAIALNIPRILFYGHGIFPSCVHESLLIHTPHKRVSDDSEVFVVEGLPHRIELTRSEVSWGLMYTKPQQIESVGKSYGVVVNSFYELEPEYAELYRENGTRAYYVGPVSLSTKDGAAKADRGQKLNPTMNGLLTWLDSMEKDSVTYVCFGSLNEFPAEQLREIATGLEASGQPFVWAVRNMETKAGTDWMPDGLEERVKGKGVVIRGWAPQIVILDHPAVGGFVTHCGWNSILESVSAGVPMVTWPIEYEQFVNERLILQVLQIGVSVGRGESGGDGKKKVVKAEQIAKAVKDVMGEEQEAKERRARVWKYADMAKAAMEEGGSSYMDMTRLIEDIKEYSLNGAPSVSGR